MLPLVVLLNCFRGCVLVCAFVVVCLKRPAYRLSVGCLFVGLWFFLVCG